MSNGWRVVGLLVVAVLAGPMVVAPGRVGASHFGWLGHGACPWSAKECETRVPPEFVSLGRFQSSTYRLPDEASSEWAGEARVEALRARDGTLIARVGAGFRKELDAQGSARLRDGRIVNVDDKIDGQTRYLVVKNAPYGVGAPGYRLMPYRTVAVNPHRVPVGTVLYLPSLAGVTLPSGDVHDGFCFAHDSDEAAGRDDIALFVGYGGAVGVFGSNPGRTSVLVYRVDAETARVLNRRFKDQFDWSG